MKVTVRTVLFFPKRRNSGKDVFSGLHVDRRIKDSGKLRTAPSFSSGTVKSLRHCFEGHPGGTNAMTAFRQIMKICRELRIREDRAGITAWPTARGSV
jgi:hypothetical protein